MIMLIMMMMTRMRMMVMVMMIIMRVPRSVCFDLPCLADDDVKYNFAGDYYKMIMLIMMIMIRK